MSNELQEKRQLLKAFNGLQSRRTEGHLTMAMMLHRINGIESALEFIAKMKEYDQAEAGEQP